MNNHKQRFGDSESTKWVLFDYLIPGGIGIWKCWFLSRGENWSTQRKTPWSEGEKQPQTPTHIWCQHWDLNPGHIDAWEASALTTAPPLHP